MSDTLYCGTIHTLPQPLLSAKYLHNAYTTINLKDIKFWKFPLESCNEISISVKASHSADVLLLLEGPTLGDEPNSDSIMITFGENQNIPCTIRRYGISQPLATAKLSNIINPTYFSAFIIKWNQERLAVFKDGDEEPFLLWYWSNVSSKTFNNMGIRTVGCSGEWIIQGGLSCSTIKSEKFEQYNEINSGRLEFEVRSNGATYILLSNTPSSSNPKPVVEIVFGRFVYEEEDSSSVSYNDHTRTRISCHCDTFINTDLKYDRVEQNKLTEYKKYWVKWDSFSIWFGKQGSDTAIMASENRFDPYSPPMPKLEYVAFYSEYDAFWRIKGLYPVENLPLEGLQNRPLHQY